MSKSSRASIPFILITVLIDMMGIGIVIPVLPTLVGSFTKDTETQAYWYGALVFVFGITQFLCAPLLGALSDRFGRRLVLLLSIGGLGLMFFFSAIVESLPALLATRVLGGALASNVSIANAYIADVTKPEDRAKSFGKIGAAFGVGFILGPMIGGLVGGLGIRYPFFVAAGFSLLNFGYGLLVLPESLPVERRRPIDLRKANPFGALVGLVRLKGVGLIVTVIALVNLAQFILYTTWVLYNTHRFGWGPPENGASFFVVGVLAAVVQGALLGPLLKKFGEKRLVLMGLTSATGGYVCYGLATHGWMMYATLLLNLLSVCVATALNALVSKAAPPNEQGLAMGSLSSLNSLVAVIAPALGIPLFARVSHLPKTDVRVGASFFLSAGLSACALGMAIYHFSREQKRAGTVSDDNTSSTNTENASTP